MLRESRSEVFLSVDARVTRTSVQRRGGRMTGDTAGRCARPFQHRLKRIGSAPLMELFNGMASREVLRRGRRGAAVVVSAPVGGPGALVTHSDERRGL